MPSTRCGYVTCLVKTSHLCACFALYIGFVAGRALTFAELLRLRNSVLRKRRLGSQKGVCHEIHNQTQANRGAVDDEVQTALEELPAVLKHMGVNCLAMSNVEADDLIATFAATYSKTSAVTIYSADKVC